jgi:hypothetical protein
LHPSHTVPALDTCTRYSTLYGGKRGIHALVTYHVVAMVRGVVLRVDVISIHHHAVVVIVVVMVAVVVVVVDVVVVNVVAVVDVVPQHLHGETGAGAGL